MPIYEYKCKTCDQVSEYLVGVGRNSDELNCKNCGGSDLERLMSTASVSMAPTFEGHGGGSTCCGSNPEAKGCVPGSCCGGFLGHRRPDERSFF